MEGFDDIEIDNCLDGLVGILDDLLPDDDAGGLRSGVLAPRLPTSHA